MIICACIHTISMACLTLLVTPSCPKLCRQSHRGRQLSLARKLKVVRPTAWARAGSAILYNVYINVKEASQWKAESCITFMLLLGKQKMFKIKFYKDQIMIRTNTLLLLSTLKGIKFVPCRETSWGERLQCRPF